MKLLEKVGNESPELQRLAGLPDLFAITSGQMHLFQICFEAPSATFVNPCFLFYVSENNDPFFHWILNISILSLIC